MKTTKNTSKTSKKSESRKHETTGFDTTERLTKEDLKALRTNVKGGIPARCCEYFPY